MRSTNTSSWILTAVWHNLVVVLCHHNLILPPLSMNVWKFRLHWVDGGDAVRAWERARRFFEQAAMREAPRTSIGTSNSNSHGCASGSWSRTPWSVVQADSARQRVEVVAADAADDHVADARNRVRQIVMAAGAMIDAVFARARDTALEPAQLAHQPLVLR
jgi:hypothetical protein